MLFGIISAALWCSPKTAWVKYSLACVFVSGCFFGIVTITKTLSKGNECPTWDWTLFKSEQSLVAGTTYERLGEQQEVNKGKAPEEKDGARFITILFADGAKFPEAYALTKPVPARFVVSKKPDGSLEFVLHLPPDFVPAQTQAKTSQK